LPHLVSSAITGGWQDRRWGYFTVSFVGYIAGLLLTHVISEAFQAPQPALLYLAPAVLLPTMAQAWRRGALRRMWRHQGHTEQRKHSWQDRREPGQAI